SYVIIQPSEVFFYGIRNQLVVKPVVILLPFASEGLSTRNVRQKGRMVGGGWEECLELYGDRVHQGSGNLVPISILAREALPHRVGIAQRVIRDCLRGWIVDLVNNVGKVTGHIPVCRKRIKPVLVAVIHNLVIDEIEEHLVLHNGSADRPAKIVVA